MYGKSSTIDVIDDIDTLADTVECGDGQVLTADVCCTPNCDGTECGDDGCGGSCGECSNAANGVEKACQEGMCVCEMFKPIASNYVPEADGSGNKIYMNCVENIITCIYSDGTLVDYNNPSILLPNSSTISIDLLQGEAFCENNLTQWLNWDSYYVVNNNTTCEFEFDKI